MSEVNANPVEAAAREYCAKLLTSRAARALPKEAADALVIVAFSLGAAWALGRPDMADVMERGDPYLRKAREAIAAAESAVETGAKHPAAENLRQLADNADAHHEGDMVSFTPSALRAIADSIDGKGREPLSAGLLECRAPETSVLPPTLEAVRMALNTYAPGEEARVLEEIAETVRFARETGDDWQPIETAPTDGTEVILCHMYSDGSDWQCIGYHTGHGRGGWTTGKQWMTEVPTHWRPMLAPPRSSVKAEANVAERPGYDANGSPI